MASGDISYRSSILLSTRKFISHYRATNAQYVAVTGASIIFGLSGLPSLQPRQNLLAILALLFIIISILYHYISGRPFGIDLSCTPTHLVDGQRQPDKIAENRDLLLLQDGSCTLHGHIQLSKLISQFNIQFSPSDEINADLRNKPKQEHTYLPQDGILKCEKVSERNFPWVLEIYSNSSVSTNDRYHKLELIDLDSNRTLARFDVIDVSY